MNPELTRHVKNFPPRMLTAEVCEALRVQNNDSPVAQELLKKAATKPCSVVCAGQQTGIFLGPTLILIKAITVLQRARQIEEITGLPCLPIFWIQEEDHDWDEISSLTVVSQQGDLATVTLPPLSTQDSRTSIAHLAFSGDVQSAFDLLKAALGDSPHASEMEKLFSSAYATGQSPSVAFAQILRSLFGGQGLLTFSLRTETSATAAVQKLLLPIYRRTFENMNEISSLLRKSSAQTEQVHVRENSPLFFFHPTGPQGPRYRLEKRADGWSCVGSSEIVATDQLQRALQDSPLSFSSSALLRPIVQDTLFPTAVFVGGDAEIRYQQQLTSIYPLFGLTQPLLEARKHLTILEPRTRRYLNESELSVRTLPQSTADTERYLASQQSSIAPTPESLQTEFSAFVSTFFAKLTAPVAALDTTLREPLTKTKESLESNFGKFLARYSRSLSQRDTVLTRRLQILQNSLFPKNLPQERVIGSIQFLWRYGLGILDVIEKALSESNSNEVEISL